MKKLIFTAVCAGFTLGLFAQESDKKVQLGMAYQFGLNFNKPGTKVIGRDGSGVQNMIGMNMNYSFTPNIGFFTGLEFDFESFRYNVKSTDKVYYRFVDSKIYQKEDGTSGTTLFNLQNRKQKAIYATIPTMLLFRTNMIGSFRYYGKFGARTSFLLSSNTNDKGFTFSGNTPAGAAAAATNENMKSKGDMFFLRSSIGLAAGAEWNFTGSTSVFAEIGFYYGFTPVHNGEAIGGDDKERNMTLYQSTKDGVALSADDYLNLSAKQKQIVFKVGILF